MADFNLPPISDPDDEGRTEPLRNISDEDESQATQPISMEVDYSHLELETADLFRTIDIMDLPYDIKEMFTGLQIKSHRLISPGEHTLMGKKVDLAPYLGVLEVTTKDNQTVFFMGTKETKLPDGKLLLIGDLSNPTADIYLRNTNANDKQLLITALYGARNGSFQLNYVKTREVSRRSSGIVFTVENKNLVGRVVGLFAQTFTPNYRVFDKASHKECMQFVNGALRQLAEF